jgi:hypothetical protein
MNGLSHGALRLLNRWCPGYNCLAKAEGMLRFYREGQKPIEEQNLPEGLQKITL